MIYREIWIFFKYSECFSVPEVLGLYEELGVKHEPLRLIAPQFETPFPPLQLAVSNTYT